MIQYYLTGINKPYTRVYLLLTALTIIQLNGLSLQAQSCPANSSLTINTFPNTYYPGTTATLNAGSTSIALGAVSYGTTPIEAGDLLLLIQMQGAQIGHSNDSTYGKNYTGDSRVSGYIDNTQNLAGNMEYVVATNAVSLAGGTVNLLAPTTKNYRSAAYNGSDGQYTYQVIRVATYYNLTINNNIDVPHWNGATGGVMAICVTNNLDMNSMTISALGAGFRGGGGVMLNSTVGGSATTFRSLSTTAYHAAKGEGIAGTPRYVHDNGVLIDYGSMLEGYPGGSMGMGAPGNAGGGGTQPNKHTANTNNSGGSGGSNGSIGGKGGNSWSSNLPVGGEPGASFAQASLSRLVMGGGGGAGCNDDGTGTPGAGLASSGAAGGGIVIIHAKTITGSGAIDVSGASGNTTVANDAAGGGGGGGSVIIAATSGLAGVTVMANGGTGGSNSGIKVGFSTSSPHGPGGGGGGGVIFASGTLDAASSTSGGANGTTGNIAYGAGPGTVSSLLMQNQIIPSPMSCLVLSLNFLSVTATDKNEKISIQWKVTNETGILKYIIERSTDGLNFTPAGSQPCRSYNSGINDYLFSDLTPCTGSHAYYRVRALTVQGASTYSTIVMVKRPVVAGSAFISPNPVRTSASLNLVSATNGNVEIKLIDSWGRTCWRQFFTVSAGANVLPVEGLEKLPNGAYWLQYNNNGKPKNTKLLIQH